MHEDYRLPKYDIYVNDDLLPVNAFNAEDTKYFNFDNIPTGSFYEANYRGKRICGRIYKLPENGHIYLCHNVRFSYDSRYTGHYGFQYSTFIEKGQRWQLGWYKVDNLKIHNYIPEWDEHNIIPKSRVKLKIHKIGQYEVSHINTRVFIHWHSPITFDQVEEIYEIMKFRQENEKSIEIEYPTFFADQRIQEILKTKMNFGYYYSITFKEIEYLYNKLKTNIELMKTFHIFYDEDSDWNNFAPEKLL